MERKILTREGGEGRQARGAARRVRGSSGSQRKLSRGGREVEYCECKRWKGVLRSEGVVGLEQKAHQEILGDGGKRRELLRGEGGTINDGSRRE